MYIALVAETFKRADDELMSIVEANRAELTSISRYTHSALFSKSNLLIKAFCMHDMTSLRSETPHQIFCTRRALDSDAVKYLYDRVKSRCCTPEDYIIQILEEEREINYES